ncbi:hypothetical protein OG866_43620 [Streptomyces sp. NBC_00663]|uniref:hypothetical protein n=1 Tax=Streptomyces sp. NBC_00663 TaxID=2975801 RepID=UPI002E315AC8|nr:hypothetical protein [Streptomyces sp. NBC_00663]
MIPVADEDNAGAGSGRSGLVDVLRGGSGAGHPVALAMYDDGSLSAQLPGGFAGRQPWREGEETCTWG